MRQGASRTLGFAFEPFENLRVGQMTPVPGKEVIGSHGGGIVTRIDPATGKLMFRVYDYTNATRLFGAEFLTKFARRAVREPKPEYEAEKADAPAPVQVEGFKVQISDAGRFILADENGREVLLTVEEYKERLAQQLIAQAATLDEFRARWVNPDQRRELITHLLDAGLSPSLIRTVEEMAEYDLYDVLGELGYGLDARTRSEFLTFIEIRDRSKDLVKSGGEWISTLALEGALMGHPAVAEAAVIAVPDPKWQERPLAVIVLKEGKTATPSELIEFLAARFPKWQLPDAVEFVDALPRTATGKFLKTALRERFKDYTLAKTS